MNNKGQLDVVGGFFGSILGIFFFIFSFIASIFPLVLTAIVFLVFIGIIFIMWHTIKKRLEKIDVFTPRQITYISTIESSLMLKNPHMKDLWISGDGKTPHLKLGNIVGFNSEPSKLKSVSEQQAKILGIDIIYTFVFRDTKGLFKKVIPKLIPVRVFKKDVLDGNLLGSIIIVCSGIRKKGFYYYPTSYGNYDALFLEHLTYENVEASFEKAQDKWGEFADSNIKQKQWYLMDVEKSKSVLEMPFTGKGEKKK